ncbi:MAG: hypothetical protein GF331_18435, partial [Chitinivibrionales bacterium]|nr:hypothetical protein [Chitinivibrionales bacterium]
MRRGILCVALCLFLSTNGFARSGTAAIAGGATGLALTTVAVGLGAAAAATANNAPT